MTVRCFCTYFDSNYLPRALALYASLKRHCPNFRLWALCMDKGCYETLAALALPEVVLIRLEDLERDDPALCGAKQNRSRVEYYFTCTPSLPLFVFANWLDVDLITYLDADLFFFADPAPLFDELGVGSVLLVPHRFPTALCNREQYGVYNVGYLSFRRDQYGLECLGWWRERCLEWCFDRVEPGRFADQKYLDSWPQRFAGVVVAQHPGANLAPWNVNGHALASSGTGVCVDGWPLLFYHFHGLRQIYGAVYDPGLAEYDVQLTEPIRSAIYLPYIRELEALRRSYAQDDALGRRATLLDGRRSPAVRAVRAAVGVMCSRYLVGRAGRNRRDHR